jgi:cell wall-associated NlpC family hydrolase
MLRRISRGVTSAVLVFATMSAVAAIDCIGIGLDVASAGPAAGTSSYTVKPGDSLIRIARRAGVRLNDLLSLNRLTTASLIWPGMQLKLPAGATPPPVGTAASKTTAAPKPVGATYTIVAGDTLGGIARRHGVRLGDLLSVNNITATSLILPGRVLQLPVGAVVAVAATTTSTTTSTTTTTTVANTPRVSTTAPVTGNATIDAVLAFAQAQIGKPYKFFTAGPDTFDCSGLTRASYLQAGISLPHQSGAQSELGTAVDWTTQTIQPGDLVFLTRDGLETSPISHVGIATSATTWIHATRPGDVVRAGTIPTWRVVEVRRIV